MRSDLPCASPRGRPRCRSGARRRLERFSIRVRRWWVLFPLYSLPGREAAKEAGSARSAPGGKCSNGRLRSASAAPCSVLMALATARDAASVRTSPAVLEPARLAAAALLLLGAGPAGCPPRLLLQPASGLPLPVTAAPPGSELRWEPPTKVSVPRATGAEERADTPRSPSRAASQFRLPAARRAPLLKRGWRLPCAHACWVGFPWALGRQGTLVALHFPSPKVWRWPGSGASEQNRPMGKHVLSQPRLRSQLKKE